MSVSDSPNGTYTAIGGPADLYESALIYTNLTTIRAVIATAGTKYLRFTVTGKNASSSGYLVVPDCFTLVPVDTTTGFLQGWRSAYFGTTENTGVAADLADPDADGFVNLLEYATGSYPTMSDGPLWTSGRVGDHLTLTFPRLRDATDIVYSVVASNDLVAETEIWSSSTMPYPGGAAASYLTTVTDPQSTTESSSRFLKLEIVHQ